MFAKVVLLFVFMMFYFADFIVDFVYIGKIDNNKTQIEHGF